ENGGNKSADVADDAAAEGDQQRTAVSAGAHHLARQAFDIGHRLVLLAGRKKEGDGRLGKGVQECLVPKSPDLRRGENKDAPRQAAYSSFHARSKRLQQAAARENIIFCRGSIDADGLHSASIVNGAPSPGSSSTRCTQLLANNPAQSVFELRRFAFYVPA